MTRDEARKFRLTASIPQRYGASIGYNATGPYGRDPNAFNVFGAIKKLDSTGEYVNMTCEHGGSQWLCDSCARLLVSAIVEAMQETGIERHWRELEKSDRRGE